MISSRMGWASKCWLCLVLFFFSLMFVSTSFAENDEIKKDPYEKFNRVIFSFNETVDKYILKPIARFYIHVMPHPFARSIRNFFSNIETVPTVANDVLQTNFYQATRDTWRLMINSTVGVIGFFDVGSKVGLLPNKEDFGLTLARWGYENSNYLVLPFLGPSTPRDMLGMPVDYYFFSVYPYIHPDSTRYQLYALNLVSRRAGLLDYQNIMQQAAVDRYVFVREAYMQRRVWLIQRNKELGDPYLESDTVVNSADIK